MSDLRLNLKSQIAHPKPVLVLRRRVRLKAVLELHVFDANEMRKQRPVCEIRRAAICPKPTKFSMPSQLC